MATETRGSAEALFEFSCVPCREWTLWAPFLLSCSDLVPSRVEMVDGETLEEGSRRPFSHRIDIDMSCARAYSSSRPVCCRVARACCAAACSAEVLLLAKD